LRGANILKSGKNETDEREKVRSTDLFLGAYLITEGFSLENLIMDSSRSRNSITFVISGDGVEGFAKKFQMGHAMTNACLYKVSMNYLKDRLHDCLRENKTEIERNRENGYSYHQH
jgi:hypothetical protein